MKDKDIKEIYEFEKKITEHIFENMNDPLNNIISITRVLSKVCISVGISLEEVIYNLSDCYAHYEEIANRNRMI